MSPFCILLPLLFSIPSTISCSGKLLSVSERRLHYSLQELRNNIVFAYNFSVFLILTSARWCHTFSFCVSAKNSSVSLLLLNKEEIDFIFVVLFFIERSEVHGSRNRSEHSVNINQKMSHFYCARLFTNSLLLGNGVRS